MDDYKVLHKPMVTTCNLNKNDDSTTINQSKYQSMIRSLLYLTGSRPNIMHAIGI